MTSFVGTRLVPAFVRAVAASDRFRPHVVHVLHLTQQELGAGNFGHMDVTGEERLAGALGVLGPAVVAIDIGANSGAWTGQVLAHNPAFKVIAVEPGSAAFARLAKRFAEDKRVACLNVAVDSDDGLSRLFGGDGLGEFATLYPTLLDKSGFLAEVDSITEEVVVTRTLPTLIADCRISGFLEDGQTVGVIKIDTEGGELDIIQQIRQLGICDHVAVVQFEFNVYSLLQAHPLADYVEALGAGFRFFRLGRRVLVPYEELSREDANFFGFSNWCAVRSEFASAVTARYRDRPAEVPRDPA